MSNSTNGRTCANVEGIPCSNSASQVCSRCYLVQHHICQYCTRECQRSHWPLHKDDCNSSFRKESWKPAWDVEGRSPTFVGSGNETNFSPLVAHGAKKYLWGNVPAVDILNLDENEGIHVPSPLRLLFAASGDLRNIVKTLAKLRQTYAGQCEVVINDKEFDIVARNTIMLLTAMTCPADIASEAMLHIWYSAFITQGIFDLLQEKVKPLIDDICEKLRTDPSTAPKSKTWTLEKGKVRLILKKEMWNALQAYFSTPPELSKIRAQQIMEATTLSPARKDYSERFLYSQLPGWRVGAIKFRKEGILHPFGASTASFSVPNPTIFQSRDFWPMMDSANALEGWPIEEILRRTPARNDLYGGMYHLVKDCLRQFCAGIALRPTEFTILHVDAAELPATLAVVNKELPGSFARIEVSNIVDSGYLGTAKTLSTLAPLLQPKSSNPHAAILTLYLNAVYEIDPAGSMRNKETEMRKVLSYLPPINPRFLLPTSCDAIKAVEACMHFRNFDAFFHKYEEQVGFQGIGQAFGLQVRNRNRIVAKWPMRLKENASKSEFDVLQASGHVGSERYVEWERAE